MKIRRGHLRWKQVYNLEILGLGNDIIEIERIEKAVNRSDKFMEKIYSEKEREYLSDKKGFTSYAGKFAAKEAVAKAMGTGVRGFAMSDIEILNDEMGKPYVLLSKELSEKYSGIKFMITISHSRENAVATAIAIKD